jgi:hypothetical protein
VTIEDLQSLAQRAERFAETLSTGERRALTALIYTACDPLGRISMRDPRDLFSEEELHLLEQIHDRFQATNP